MFGTRCYSFNQHGINRLTKDLKKDKNRNRNLVLAGSVVLALTITGVTSTLYAASYFGCEATRTLVKWIV